MYQVDFIVNWVHSLLFIEAEPWTFTLCYSVFELVVLLTFFLAPRVGLRSERLVV